MVKPDTAPQKNPNARARILIETPHLIQPKRIVYNVENRLRWVSWSVARHSAATRLNPRAPPEPGYYTDYVPPCRAELLQQPADITLHIFWRFHWAGLGERDWGERRIMRPMEAPAYVGHSCNFNPQYKFTHTLLCYTLLSWICVGLYGLTLVCFWYVVGMLLVCFGNVWICLVWRWYVFGMFWLCFG